MRIYKQNSHAHWSGIIPFKKRLKLSCPFGGCVVPSGGGARASDSDGGGFIFSSEGPQITCVCAIYPQQQQQQQ